MKHLIDYNERDCLSVLELKEKVDDVFAKIINTFDNYILNEK